MVCYKLPRSRTGAMKNVTQYKLKDACLVLSPTERMDFAKLYLLLFDGASKEKAKDSKPSVTQKSHNDLKTKGSQISGPLLFKLLYIKQNNNFFFTSIQSLN